MQAINKSKEHIPSIFELEDSVQLKHFEPRLYQQTILDSAAKKNCLVVLPTGMGKTGIALMLASQRLNQFPKSKILTLAPTKPLAEQIMQFYRKHLTLDEGKIVLFTGQIAPEKRQLMWKDAKIIVSTPQGLENDIIGNKIRLDDVSLLVVDECHRSTGEYSYNFIAKQYEKQAKMPRILALTASPGSDITKIAEICENLFIEDIEIRTEEDPDVRPYVQDVKVEWKIVSLPEELQQVRKYILDCLKERLKAIREKGYMNQMQLDSLNKTDLLRLQAQIHAEIAQGNKDFEMLKMISLIAEALKIQHALELCETQSTTALLSYLEKLEKEALTTKVKAVQNLVKDLNFRSALIKTRLLNEKGIEHPKLESLIAFVKQEIEANPQTKIIIFNQYRDNAQKIVENIGSNSRLFIGQQKKNGQGLSQKKQIEMLDDFREGKFNVLVSTAVGEEGIDIPQVDIVVFYEPIPSAIRSIQRRGRTGRNEKGKVIVMMAKGTRDEAYKWSAHHKERRMDSILRELKSKINFALKKKDSSQSTLTKFKIIADNREKASGVIKELIELGAEMGLERLDIADYLLSSRVAIEFKTVPDFVDSLIDGRLLGQLKDLKTAYERPLVIVEGVEDIYSMRKVHPNAIRGMIAAITVGYGIPIIYTKGPKDTASMMQIIALREQEGTDSNFTMHSKKPITEREVQEYIVSSLPGISTQTAKSLLANFGSVKEVFNASQEKLKETENIGNKKAQKIREIIDKNYETI